MEHPAALGEIFCIVLHPSFAIVITISSRSISSMRARPAGRNWSWLTGR